MSMLWDLFVLAFADGKTYATKDIDSKAAAPSTASPHRKQQQPSSKHTADKSTGSDNTTPAPSPDAFASLDKNGGRYMASVRRKRRAAAGSKKRVASIVQKAAETPDRADPSPVEKAAQPPNTEPETPQDARAASLLPQHAVPSAAQTRADPVNEQAAAASPKQAVPAQETAEPTSLSSPPPLPSSSASEKELLPSRKKAATPPSPSPQKAVSPSSEKTSSPPMQEVDPGFQEAKSSAKDRVLPPSEWEQGLPLKEVKVPSAEEKTAVSSGEHAPPPPAQDLHISHRIWLSCTSCAA